MSDLSIYVLPISVFLLLNVRTCSLYVGSSLSLLNFPSLLSELARPVLTSAWVNTMVSNLALDDFLNVQLARTKVLPFYQQLNSEVLQKSAAVHNSGFHSQFGIFEADVLPYCQ